MLYRAKHRKTGQWRAVKIATQSAIDLKRWNAELEVLRRCEHQHLCNLREHFTGGGQLCQVLELCWGKTLQAFSVDEGCLPEVHCSFLFRQILAAVGHLHDNGYCHLELRPTSFMFTKSRLVSLSEAVLKLVHVGRAERIGSAPSKTQAPSKNIRSRSGSLHQAPELVEALARSTLVTSDLCDIWALGCIAFQILCGALPVVNASGNIKASEAHSERAWNAASTQARSFMCQCLELEPTQRPRVVQLQANPWVVQRKGSATEDGSRQSIRKSSSTTSDVVVKAFLGMAEMSAFELAVLTLAIHNLPEERTSQLHSIFQRSDRDGDGRLAAAELVHALEEAVGQLKSPSELPGMLYPIAGARTLDYHEYVAVIYWSSPELQEEVCEAVGNVLDWDEQGTVTLSELQEAFGFDGKAKVLSLMGDGTTEKGSFQLSQLKRLLQAPSGNGSQEERAAAKWSGNSQKPLRSGRRRRGGSNASNIELPANNTGSGSDDVTGPDGRAQGWTSMNSIIVSRKSTEDPNSPMDSKQISHAGLRSCLRVGTIQLEAEEDTDTLPQPAVSSSDKDEEDEDEDEAGEAPSHNSSKRLRIVKFASEVSMYRTFSQVGGHLGRLYRTADGTQKVSLLEAMRGRFETRIPAVRGKKAAIKTMEKLKDRAP